MFSMYSSEQQVYAVSVPSGYCKIGIATNPASRVGSLQTGNHEPLSLFEWTSPDDDAPRGVEIERAAHSLLDYKHERGEWFKAPEREVRQAMYLAYCCVRDGVPVQLLEELDCKWRGRLTEAVQSVFLSGDMRACVGVEPFNVEAPPPENKRKAYRRDWMRKKRAEQNQDG